MSIKQGPVWSKILPQQRVFTRVLATSLWSPHCNTSEWIRSENEKWVICIPYTLHIADYLLIEATPLKSFPTYEVDTMIIDYLPF